MKPSKSVKTKKDNKNYCLNHFLQFTGFLPARKLGSLILCLVDSCFHSSMEKQFQLLLINNDSLLTEQRKSISFSLLNVKNVINHEKLVMRGKQILLRRIDVTQSCS